MTIGAPSAPADPCRAPRISTRQEVGHLQHSIVVTDYSDPPFRVRYRRIGATQRPYRGEDFTGRFLDELAWPEKHLAATVHEAAFRSRVPVFGAYSWEFRDPLSGFCEFGTFPLSADGGAVSGGISFDDYSFFEQQLGRAR